MRRRSCRAIANSSPRFANSATGGSGDRQDASSNGKVGPALGRALKPHSTFAYFLEKFQPEVPSKAAAAVSEGHSALEKPDKAATKPLSSPPKPEPQGPQPPAPEVAAPPAPAEVAVDDFPGCEPGGPSRPKYEHIDANVYRRSQPKLTFRAWLCDCVLPSDEDQLTKDYKACTDECMNRLLQIECTDRCNCGSYCANNRFANKLYAPLTPFYAGQAKGWGLKTTADVPAGAFLIEYVGEVIDFAQFKRRISAYEKSGCPHHYFMSLESDVIVDAGAMGNWARFANHSCAPNSDIQKWTVGRQQRVGFFALRDIPAGEEVTVDYGFVQYGRELQKCYCNSPNCTGVMGSRSQQLQDRVQARDSSARDRQVARLLRMDRLGSTDDARCLVRLLVQESLDWETRMRLVRLVSNTVCSVSLQALRRCHAVDVLSSYLRELVAKDSASEADSAETLVQALSQLPVAYTQHVAQAMPLLERLGDCAAARDLLERWRQLPGQPFGGLRIPKKRLELRQQLPDADDQPETPPPSIPPATTAVVQPLIKDLPQAVAAASASRPSTRRLPKAEFRRLFEAYVAFEDEQRKAAAEAEAAAAAAAAAKPSPADLLNDEQAMDKVIGLLSKFLNYMLSNGDPQCALTEAELLSVAGDRRLLGLLEYIRNLDDVSIITDKMELMPPPQPPQQPSEQERISFAEQLHLLVAECVDGVFASGCVDETVRPRHDRAVLAPQLAQQLMSPNNMEQLMRHTGGCLVLDSTVQDHVREFVVEFMMQPALVNGISNALQQ